MNTTEINATFSVAINTINAHIALAESNFDSPAVKYVHFEREGDILRIISTNGRVLLLTQTETICNLPTPAENFNFDVRGMMKVSAKRAMTLGDAQVALFTINDGLLQSGDVIAKVTESKFPEWRKVVTTPSNLEPETAWRSLNPKYYALALKFTDDDNGKAKRKRGEENGPVYFVGESKKGAFQEANMAAVMPLRHV